MRDWILDFALLSFRGAVFALRNLGTAWHEISRGVPAQHRATTRVRPYASINECDVAKVDTLRLPIFD
jgi:hypothetical protein